MICRVLGVEDARRAVAGAVEPLPSEDVAVERGLGRVLAADAFALADVPAFANSAMDGFAVAAGAADRRLRIVGESRAGAPADVHVGAAEAVRISTGALMPPGADAVVPVEEATDEHEHVVVHVDAPPGRHVRLPGEDVRAGTAVLRAGERLDAGALGAAVVAGHAALTCTRRPRVAVVATGDELRPPGAPLQPGQLHDANAVTISALAADAGAAVVSVERVGDDRRATEAALGRALEAADLVVVSGGVSVGPHDHVKPALSALGVEEVFWRVALRPGKPTWFGARDGRPVLGLPGNPVSAMVTFVLFGRVALRRLEGEARSPARRRAALGAEVPRHPRRDEAVRVHLHERDGGAVAWPTGPQGSHVVTSMLGADGLALVRAGDGRLAAGAVVDVELL